MAIVGGIRVYELVKGNEEGLSYEGGPTARKAYYVPDWYDRYAVANSLIGISSYSVGPGTISLNIPGVYPESADMWAQRISIRGVGTPTQGPKQIAWTSAIVEVEYGVPKYNFSQSQDPGGVNSFDPTEPMVWATQSLDFGGQVVTVPAGACTLNDGSNTPLNQPYGLFVGVVTMDLTLHRLPYILPGSSRANAAYINSNPIFSCAAGTLLWRGASTDRQLGGNGGIITQETRMRFSYRPAAAWDKILHPITPSKGWTQVRYNGSSVLKSVDFSTLIPGLYTAST